jgi:hypothetical protein
MQSIPEPGTKPLEAVQDIIRKIQTQIEKKKQIWGILKRDNPGWEQLSDENWRLQNALSWIHGEADTFKRAEYERWLFDRTVSLR